MLDVFAYPTVVDLAAALLVFTLGAVCVEGAADRKRKRTADAMRKSAMRWTEPGRETTD